MPDCALRAAQRHIGSRVYYGSGFVARHASENAGGSIRVLTADWDPECRERLRGAGLSMLDEEFPRCGVRSGRYDAWDAFAEIAPVLAGDDLVLLDPYREFLRDRVPKVVPQMAEAAARRAVLLFALNEAPDNEDGQRFDELLERHVPGAWRMTCPRLPWVGVKGESKYHVDVVLAARPLLEGGSPDVDRLRKTLAEFTGDLAGVLGLPAGTLDPRDVHVSAAAHPTRLRPGWPSWSPTRDNRNRSLQERLDVSSSAVSGFGGEHRWLSGKTLGRTLKGGDGGPSGTRPHDGGGAVRRCGRRLPLRAGPGTPWSE